MVTATVESGLRKLAAQKGISIGTEWTPWKMRDKRFWEIMTNDFTTVQILEFSCQKDFWRGRKDYNFERADRATDIAIGQGWKVRASHLVWGVRVNEESCAPPEWLSKGNFSRQEYIQILEEHVKTVVTHFKGRVTEWSIANEAISRSFCKGCDFWGEKIGPEYIEMVFRWAKESDPSGILIFNETENHSPSYPHSQRIIAKLFSTTKELKAKGAPIDAIGMHMHLLAPWYDQTPPKKEDVINTMRMFAELGVDIYITELDVNLQNVTGTQQERWEYQAKIYRDVIEACLESKVCKSFDTWGLSDAVSWYTIGCTGCPNQPNSDPLMFDKEYRPKPAYFAVRDTLVGKPTFTPTPKP
jgi:endo-1,4-beta-xylanase